MIDGVDVMSALEYLFDESTRKREDQRVVEEQERAEDKEKAAIEAGRTKRGATGRRDPQRMELMNCRRNFK